jgi:hypothetical protein
MIKRLDIPIAVEFVRLAPKELQEQTLYVSMEYASAVHKCFCGCGYKVVTPLSPAGWQLFFDGRTVTLTPSIGNWAFPCKSHYWIEGNRVRWAGQFSTAEIDRVRKSDRRDMEQLVSAEAAGEGDKISVGVSWREKWKSFWRRLNGE